MIDNEVRIKRLGHALSEENVAQVSEALDKMELPVIPLDITLGEAQELLAYHGSMISFLVANFRAKEAEVLSAKMRLEIAVNDAYNEVYNANRSLKTTEVKNISMASPMVKEAQKALMDAQAQLAKITAHKEALEAQNINLRKIVSMIQASMEKDIA